MNEKTITTIKELFDFEKNESFKFTGSLNRKIPISNIDINTFKEYCIPMLGAESIEPFGKYGYTFTGICDGWNWKDDALMKAPESDLWKMLAISETYWGIFYRKQKKECEEEKDGIRRELNLSKVAHLFKNGHLSACNLSVEEMKNILLYIDKHRDEFFSINSLCYDL